MYHRDYDNIQMTEQLRQLMTLDANMNILLAHAEIFKDIS